MTGTGTRTRTMAVLEVKVTEPLDRLEKCMKTLYANGTIANWYPESTAATRVVYDVSFNDSIVRIIFIRTGEADPFADNAAFSQFMATALLGHPTRKPRRKFMVEDGRLIRWLE